MREFPVVSPTTRSIMAWGSAGWYNEQEDGPITFASRWDLAARIEEAIHAAQENPFRCAVTPQPKDTGQ